MSRFQFVADHQHTFEVKRLCQVVQIGRSSYYAWGARAPGRAARTSADLDLARRIRRVQAADVTYGAPRVTAELNDGASDGQRVNHKRVARVMALNNIAGYVKKRRVRTTIPAQSEAKVPDLLKRDFTAAAPNRRYVGDIKCRRRHLMSYADLRTMPMLPTVVQVIDGAGVQRGGIVLAS